MREIFRILLALVWRISQLLEGVYVALEEITDLKNLDDELAKDNLRGLWVREETIRREFREEIAAGLTELRYLGMLENIYTHKGLHGHEIVLVYDGRLMDTGLYKKEVVRGNELGKPFKAVWKRLDEFGPDKPPVYPEGLLALLKSSG